MICWLAGETRLPEGILRHKNLDIFKTQDFSFLGIRITNHGTSGIVLLVGGVDLERPRRAGRSESKQGVRASGQKRGEERRETKHFEVKFPASGRLPDAPAKSYLIGAKCRPCMAPG